jgi:hypothetical protein
MLKRLRSSLLILAALFCAAAAHSQVPAQYIAKMYSEALGRAPDSGGWSSASLYYQQNGCGQAALQAWSDWLIPRQRIDPRSHRQYELDWVDERPLPSVSV